MRARRAPWSKRTHSRSSGHQLSIYIRIYTKVSKQHHVNVSEWRLRSARSTNTYRQPKSIYGEVIIFACCVIKIAAYTWIDSQQRNVVLHVNKAARPLVNIKKQTAPVASSQNIEKRVRWTTFDLCAPKHTLYKKYHIRMWKKTLSERRDVFMNITNQYVCVYKNERSPAAC